jgi:hypothetical protein
MRSAPCASAPSHPLHAMPPRITRNSDRPRASDRTMVDLVLLAASLTLQLCHPQQRNAYENGQRAKPLQGNDTEWAGYRERTSSSSRGELFFLTSLFIELIDRVVRIAARATVGCLVLRCAHNATGNTPATPAQMRYLWQARLAYRLQRNRRWKACSRGMLVGEG